jgi:hypothetical protein
MQRLYNPYVNSYQKLQAENLALRKALENLLDFVEKSGRSGKAPGAADAIQAALLKGRGSTGLPNNFRHPLEADLLKALARVQKAQVEKLRKEREK